MKAVAFVCLLSLSLCLSQQTSAPDAHPSLTAAKTDNKTNPTKQEGAQPTGAPDIKLLTEPSHVTEHATDAKSPVPHETKPTEGKPAMEKANANKTTENAVPAQNESKPIEPAKKEASKETSAEGAKPTTPKPTEEAKAGAATSPTTTEKAAMVKTTEAPKDTTATPLVGKRGFDGPSFIGGIILTLGLLAIGFMGFKYYKNQTERNYHTL